MNLEKQTAMRPEIMAPAGDMDSFLAALAAGADAIYLGLKNFSARMQAKNFGLSELARLVELAHGADCRVYVAMNNLLKQSELEQAYRLAKRLADQVLPDGLIVQDLAMLNIARQARFNGSLILSTLANITSAKGLLAARELGATRVVMPRELSLDEMRLMGAECPAGLELECFVHGALCYCVSGRCYWSSYLGGSSGLRGRCVQPCRRQYERNSGRRNSGQFKGERLFACQDLELAPVIHTLFQIPHLAAWKIEGRKKGPHYVYHAVTAYRILRDEHDNPQMKKMALELLEMALGRPGVRARFLPQKKYQPMAPGGQTASGKLVGKINIQQNGSCIFKPYIELQPRDLLRIGAQDEKWHALVPVTRNTPKSAVFPLKIPAHKTPRSGTPVFLIDRKDSALLAIIKTWRNKLAKIPEKHIEDIASHVDLPRPSRSLRNIPDMDVKEFLQKGKWSPPTELNRKAGQALWLSPKALDISRSLLPRLIFWLAPAIWPENENATAQLIDRLWKNGARQFVCNAPWQRAYFPANLPKDALLIAGPFCNIANTLAVNELARSGFAAFFASPELAAEDIMALPKNSPLAPGFILGGYWPVGISRFGLAGITAGEEFGSPKGENFWSKDRAGLTWLFPAWSLNLCEKREMLEKAGYTFFAWLNERLPQGVKWQKRPGLFNWDGKLL